MKRLEEYKLIIWDLDGTLYEQKKFRKKMIKIILSSLLFKPSCWREVKVIIKYRRLREKWDVQDSCPDLEKRQYVVCGEQLGMPAHEVEKIIHRWMHEIPLAYLGEYKDHEAAELIRILREKGIMNVVYSDYPTRNKLEALGIKMDKQFCSSDPEISSMKPNPRGISYILKTTGVESGETLIIGDRMEKDGEAAKAAGIDYLILDPKLEKRKKQYEAMT